MSFISRVIPRIVVLTLLPLTQLARLKRLDDLGRIELMYVPARDPLDAERQLNAGLLHPADAVISRVRDGIVFQPEHISHVTVPFFACTPTALADQYRHIKEDPKVRILDGRGPDGASANAPAVAEFTLQLAQYLLRPAHLNMYAMCQGSSGPLPNSARRIEGMTWLILGAGSQVPLLIRILAAFLPSRILIWNRTMSASRLEECLSQVHHVSSSQTEPGRSKAEIIVPGHPPIKIIGYADWDSLSQALAEADIVSIHLKDIATSGTNRGTVGLFNSVLLGAMKPGALLINVSRGSIVVELAILEALDSGRLGGYAADVVEIAAEESGDAERSPLWTRFMKEQANILRPKGKLPNFYLMPHIAGSTAPENENGFRIVIDKLFRVLKVKEDL